MWSLTACHHLEQLCVIHPGPAGMFTEIVGIGLSPGERYGTSLFTQHELLSVSEGREMKHKAKCLLITDVFIRLHAFAHIFFQAFDYFSGWTFVTWTPVLVFAG